MAVVCRHNAFKVGLVGATVSVSLLADVRNAAALIWVVMDPDV